MIENVLTRLILWSACTLDARSNLGITGGSAESAVSHLLDAGILLLLSKFSW